MKLYQIGFISGRDLRFYCINVSAENEDDAKEKALDIAGRNFDNRITGVFEMN